MTTFPKLMCALAFALAPVSMIACDGSTPDPINTGIDAGVDNTDDWTKLLNERVYDYPAALRIAALRLTGNIPSNDEINAIAAAPDAATKKSLYEAQIAAYLARPAFAAQMFYFWRDTFKLGETAAFDTAPALAAQVAATNASYVSLFTQSAANCPTFDAATGAFTPAECGNGGPIAGVLTNPGVMQQFFSNFGFRRIRWIQEMFDCTKFPAELSATPTSVGGSVPYTGVWPFTSVASITGGGRVNFQDVSATICANCHTTINHQAPLFAYYDDKGKYQTKISVPTPFDGAPPAMLTDYLPAGEPTAWRFGVATTDIPAFGAAMAADPAVATCGVARIWNWALGKGDIVDTLEEVPADTIKSQVSAFTANGFKLKDLILAIYTSDDFTKF